MEPKANKEKKNHAVFYWAPTMYVMIMLSAMEDWNRNSHSPCSHVVYALLCEALSVTNWVLKLKTNTALSECWLFAGH